MKSQTLSVHLPVPFTLNAYGLKHRMHNTVTSQIRSSADLFI